PPIARAIAHGYGPSTVARADGRLGLEGAVDGAQDHRDRLVDSVGTSVRHRQVQPPITIEVAHGHGSTIVVSIEVPCRLEGAINVAQQHRNSAAVTSVETSVGHRQIGPPITIEAADDHAGRPKACREARGWLE